VPGTFTVRFTDQVSGVTGTATLVVTPGLVSSLTISPTESTVAEGQQQEYTVTGFDEFGNLVEDLSDVAEFEIDGGTCDANRCTGPVGDHTVTATYECICDTVSVDALLRVTAPPTTTTTTTATISSTTTPLGPGSTIVDVAPVVDPAPPTPPGPPPSAPLARTGLGGMSTMVLIGSLLVGVGAVLAAARRRGLR
jgi:hypothetical protein